MLDCSYFLKFWSSMTLLRRENSCFQSACKFTPLPQKAAPARCFITDDGYLISNYHVVKGAAKVRLLTGAGLIDATVVKVDAANDLALLSASGRFAPLPIAASRTVQLGGTVARWVSQTSGCSGLLKERSGDSAERRHFDSSQRRSADAPLRTEV
jgi:S1-C subfamily serine protease